MAKTIAQPHYSYEEATEELGWSLNTVKAYVSTGILQKRIVEGRPVIAEEDNAEVFEKRRAYVRAREASRKARLAYLNAKRATRKSAEPTAP